MPDSSPAKRCLWTGFESWNDLTDYVYDLREIAKASFLAYEEASHVAGIERFGEGGVA